ncbi:ABC transporter permease [Treponema phagedenis]|uniref:Iron ABC transporter permease n=1 Tax=Treponema phagedenis TaxID=162 RepID=A0AAE6M874_TREPH|nr:iron ABC transporter permease [Treponema phagedenis]NVP23125.1 iron ABC transporter permease [Treponema phagedenis]QEJ95389.1 iron ABC transporter permease [Treponema phagedenis]QEJ98069.1 iron ABC transporter permease [Treponema phagedenis]QEK01242.1 iron ABC transporter permease [Treponema phagedenis]QEK03574.1 iron ABC transporter permease [Treponema phagedenis]
MKKKKFDSWTIITLVIAFGYALFLLYPLCVLLFKAVFDKSSGSFTLAYFKKFFSQAFYYRTLSNSFVISTVATVLSLLIGVPLAYFFTAYRIRGKKILRVFIILSSMSAPFIGAYSWILLLGRNGVITRLLHSAFGLTGMTIYGFNGILLVFVLQLFSLIFLYVEGALATVDNSLLEASESLGVKGVKRFITVLVPLILPTILAGALLVFMRAFADFGTPMLIGEGYRTFPVLIFDEFINELGGSDEFASAIAVLAILITTIVFLLQKYVAKKNAVSMSSLHPIHEQPLHGIKKILIYVFSYGIVALAIAPQLYVLYTSFLKTKGMVFQKGYSFISYTTAFSKLGTSIQNTIIIPGISLAIIISLAVFIAYITVRKKNLLSSSIDIVSMIPYIIPGTVVGIALLGAFNRRPFLLTGSFTIMIIALIIRRLPYTIRSSVATIQQIPQSIEEAALSLGSSKLNTFFKITVPMMKSGIISGAILSWITMITELSTAIILYTAKTQTLTVAVYTEVIRGNYGVAAALSAILTLVTIFSLLLFMRVSKKQVSV